MTPATLKALAVHFLTASGAVWAMLAMLEAVQRDWNMMFLWLVVALVADGIDGPLARRYDVKHTMPVFDGVLMDLVVDYLTYVFVPAYALFNSGLLPGWTGFFAIIVITFASALYFADTRMKTRDWSFSGFPSCWNMVALVLFAWFEPGTNFWPILGLVTGLAVLMFLPVKFVHPVRTARWRAVTLPVALLWVLFAGWAAWMDFRIGPIAHAGLGLTSLYLLCAGAAQQLIYGREG
ncbi:CDP-diacylglycerol-choline O-phosphatidyltransferase [Rubellimicrobium thermophilum DSM 16684]|uniref:Phosphatidylcholine synthase n=1 Tax=Rubellimicrobium thermophilum DSM 16684 TaxID=1123069 RepID=S9SEK2_9RHOB|nr:CDP-diacylglycerol--serine O-phosphatidyltransferase [Rubellimicrobium thermophilum]EPX84689.1 CDP-diacylglycerol-choline O-phosphatidyltransferase [Rubellimicrobium thermophilum DSM 16684]